MTSGDDFSGGGATFPIGHDFVRMALRHCFVWFKAEMGRYDLTPDFLDGALRSFFEEGPLYPERNIFLSEAELVRAGDHFRLDTTFSFTDVFKAHLLMRAPPISEGCA